MFDIPNKADILAYPLRSRVYSAHWRAIALGSGRFSGAVANPDDVIVTESGSPAMSVDVASCRLVANRVAFNMTGETVLLSDAESQPRWDLIVGTSSGPDVHKGTAAEAPVPPMPAAVLLGTEVPLALVAVPAGDTAIVDAQIGELWIPIEEPTTAGTWSKIEANDETTPGAGTRSSSPTLIIDSQLRFAMTANTKYAVRAHLGFDFLTGSGLRLGFLMPAAPTRVRLVSRRGNQVAGTDTTEQVRPHSGADAVGSGMVMAGGGGIGSQLRIAWFDFEGEITNGSNAGNFGPAWSQATSVAENTVRHDGSWLEYDPV